MFSRWDFFFLSLELRILASSFFFRVEFYMQKIKRYVERFDFDKILSERDK